MTSGRGLSGPSWMLVGLVALGGCGSGPEGTGDHDGGPRDGGANIEPDAHTRDAGPSDGGAPPVGCEDGCLVDGSCYPAGAVSPTNPCQVCDPDSAATAFSPNDGAACDDGSFCTTGDVCSAGACAGAARDCNDGIACNGDETCDEGAAACAAGSPTCASGEICDALSGACMLGCAGCLIDGVCYGDGQVDPLDPCQVCAPASSATDWTDNDGARCDDGLFCTDGDVCSAGVCGGSARDCSDGVACNGAETCDEVGGACAPGTSTCASYEVCDVASDSCAPTCAGCVIGGVCFADGSRNPANPCEICDVSRARGAFSVDDGASCDDGEFCTTDDVCSGGACAGSAASFCDDGVACNGAETCSEGSDRCVAGASTCGAGEVCDVMVDACVTACSGCVIGGVCYAPSMVDPGNACQICDPARSATVWSVNAGGRCDDGLFCTTGDVCDATGACGGAARDCSDGVACNGVETCNDSSDRCDLGAMTCPGGTVCDAGADSCVVTCAGCTIGGVCYAAGTPNPANQCEVCSPSASVAGWTVNAGASCDDGLYCTVSDTCDASGVCAGTSRDCDDGVSCNGTESCDDTTDRCVAGTSACGAGQVCDAATDSCQLSCGGGTTLCGATCVDTANDPAHCGDCDTACPGVSSTAVCVSGSCAYLCDAGYTDCSAATPGCETDLATDAAHCGSCGNTCSAGEVCVAGVCAGYRTSASLVAVPGSAGCELIDDYVGDQVDAADDGTVAVLLHCGPSRFELKLSVSTDFGQTFSTPQPVISGTTYAATVHVRRADDIFVSYIIVSPSSYGGVIHTSTQGSTWDPPRNVTTVFSAGGISPYYSPSPYGAVALTSRAGVLYTSYSHDTLTYVYQSADGVSWSALSSLMRPNFIPDLGFDSSGNLLLQTSLSATLVLCRYDDVSDDWTDVGTMPDNGPSDFAFGGSWSYGGDPSSTITRASTTPGDPYAPVSRSLSGVPAYPGYSMDADADGNLYCARLLNFTTLRFFRWQAGADAIDGPTDIAVPSVAIPASATPPSGGAVVTALYSGSAQPIRVHVQGY